MHEEKLKTSLPSVREQSPQEIDFSFHTSRKPGAGKIIFYSQKQHTLVIEEMSHVSGTMQQNVLSSTSGCENFKR